MANKLSNNLKKALFDIGRLIPENEEQIELFEKLTKKDKLPKLPDVFNTPSEIAKMKGNFLSKKDNISHIQNITNEGMARAAREGKKELPLDILRKMKLDRDNAQNKKKPNS